MRTAATSKPLFHIADLSLSLACYVFAGWGVAYHDMVSCLSLSQRTLEAYSSHLRCCQTAARVGAALTAAFFYLSH